MVGVFPRHLCTFGENVSTIKDYTFIYLLGNEHDDRASRPSTSRGGGGGGGYSDRHGFNKKVTFKANNRGGNNFRRSWDNGKTDLVRNQLDSEFSNKNGQGPSRNNFGRRYFIIIIIILVVFEYMVMLIN